MSKNKSYPNPITLEAAKAELINVQRELTEVTCDLGSRSLNNDDGSRMESKEYWQYREDLKDQKIALEDRLRFLKGWIKEKNGEMNRSLRDEFAMHMLPRGWVTNDLEVAEAMAKNCYFMADLMLRARRE